MITTNCHFVMRGDSFSPKKAEALLDIEFEVKNEPGEIASRGRYKEQAYPFGYGLLRIGSMEENFGHFAKKIANWIEFFDSLGVQDTWFHVDVEYCNQCNLEFSVEFLRILGSLNIPLTVTCYEGE